MRVKVSKSKNAESYYIIKSVIIDGKNTSKIVEKLGTTKEVLEKSGGEDPMLWAKRRAAQLTKEEKEGQQKVMVAYSQNKRIPAGKPVLFNVGYLFLQQIFYELKLDQLCDQISKKYKFTYNLNSILSRLIYSRILFPASKKATYSLSKKMIEPPQFDLHHIYRALEVIYKEQDLIQSTLYKNSAELIERNDRILYYDCTNYFFEIEQESGIRQYGVSKENRPNPIVQMGLFMDGSGLPLAFTITPGNQNEQKTLKPLEKKILKDFQLSKFVVCTDAGLSSNENRKYNNLGTRAFVTTQSLKKMKQHLKTWALDSTGWFLPEQPNKKFTLDEIDEQNNPKLTFYKERWTNENGLEQRLIVSYSLKYKNYQQKIRQRQIDRALRAVSEGKKIPKKVNANDYKRFIKQQNLTPNGEIAEREVYSMNQEQINKESVYDGFYAVCTNLKDPASKIIAINKGRWEIEESFRLMKSEFKARPVNLSLDERIQAHFMTCFISLLIYRLLEKKLNESYTSCEILDTLRGMDLYEVKGEGYLPAYERTTLTDALHEVSGFHTDFQIISKKKMKKILQQTKQ